ncbi:MAG TPA: cofactor assembly of complex C subunit B [Candidatus Sulfotelmatobacter sp.]|nr:cofactor assembly of complex C subunit B [Candidatus Sulfotelmatobacter sp.]
MMSEHKTWTEGMFVSSQHPEALTELDELSSAYFDASNVGLCIFDPGLHYIAINRTLAKMNGVPAEDHLGKTVREILGEVADPIEKKISEVLQIRQPVGFEVSGTLPSRTESGHWIAHYLPIMDAQGTVRGVGAVVLEVTAPKVLEGSIQELDRRLRQETSRLQMLTDVTSLLSSNWDVAQVFPRVSAHLRRVLYQEFATFALHDARTGLLVYQATDFPLSKGLMPTAQGSPSETPVGRSMRERKPMIFSQEQLQGFDDEVAKGLLAEGLQSLCCVPLMRPKGPLGVVVLGSTRPDAFRTEDVGLINQVATQLALAIENYRTAGEIELLKQRLGEERSYLEGHTRSEGQFPEIVGDSAALRQVLDQVGTVAASDATVLILGETGTGKELIAHAIHRMSHLKHGPFIKVNCAAIPTGLLESELFGHEKGAFTGAISRKIGRIELAHGGTLFLDEVGEISTELQPKLLRVLQDQEFERLGSNHTVKVKVRVVAATNRNLSQRIAQGEFRSDLFYRLNVFPIRVPPLRERREDIPLLIRHFVHKFARRMDRYIETIPKETMKALMQWDWPGNVREIENLMERSVILSEGNALRVPLAELRTQSKSQTEEGDRTLDTAERQHIIRVLRETRGVLSGPEGAAQRLGLKRTTLQSKMQRLGIKREDYSDPEPKTG